MFLEIAEHARMSERGSSLLRLIQNDSTPLLDLLVRESVQNSLDAALPNKKFINFDINITEFDSVFLSQELEGITDSLKNRFPEKYYKLIEVRDSNTVGLTGPLHSDDVVDNHFDNLQKLVYEISMPQQKEGAGGSWGLGKTIYFRIGIGLVMYYSRIFENGEYVSRLAACLVEDESKYDAMIKSITNKPKRGIAWWGQRAGEKSSKPITDEEDINRILNKLSIQIFTGEETGTSIIIPYIDEVKLLDCCNFSDSDGIFLKSKPWWTNNIQDYLRVALQRWYAPRLNNPKFPFGPFLQARVNLKGIASSDMLPMFQLIQLLYNSIPLAVKEGLSTIAFPNVDIKTDNIILKGVFLDSGVAGYISYTRLNKSDMKMLAPFNCPSPYLQIDESNEEFDSNPPIIAFVRSPGMIVDYEISGHWTDSLPKTSQDEFIIGLFIANSNNRLNFQSSGFTLEEYIRKSERADHSAWYDSNIDSQKPMIISKIQRQVKSKISNSYSVKKDEQSDKSNIGLGRTLAGVLLPPVNFGMSGSYSTNNGGSKGKSEQQHSKGYKLVIEKAPVFVDGLMKLDFAIEFGRNMDALNLEFVVLAEANNISASKWEHEDAIGKEFPLKVEKLTIEKVKTGKIAPPTLPKDFYVDENRHTDFHNGLKMALLKSEKFKVPYGVFFKVPEKTGYSLNGSVYFLSSDNKIQGSLNVNEAGEIK